MSEYLIKCNNKSSFIVLISADDKTININVQNTSKITTSFFEGNFEFEKLIKADKYFENFESNFSLYSYFNHIFKNNKVNFDIEDNDLNIKMKFKVNEKLKEITFPLIKKAITKEQSLYVNQVLSKLMTNLQEKLKNRNDEINYLKHNYNKIKIESKIINNSEYLDYIIKEMKEEEKDKKSKKKLKMEIEFKMLFSVRIFDENIINQLLDFASQFNNQCLVIVEFNNKKICIVYTHKKKGNYYLIIDDEEKYQILDFYIDQEKFFFKLEKKDIKNNINSSKDSKKENNDITNSYNVKDFVQMEFFNCIITK
jgi:Holliday junction resolvase